MSTTTSFTARLPEDLLPPATATLGDAALDAAEAQRLHAQMALIREFESAVQPLYNEGHVHGTTHLCSGEEAIAVGVCSLVKEGDRVAATYRGHGHAIALGTEPQGLLDELLGRATGLAGGRAGSMNIIDMEHGLIGCFGIVGGSIAAATGAALALRGTGAVALAFFGDGTVNQGYFTECLNFAAVRRLPLLLVCENNLYGEFTPFEAVTGGSICERVAALGIPARRIHGNDLWEVRMQARSALERVRASGGPEFLEAITYRFGGHSRSDLGTYRPEGELEAWQAHDPLLLSRDRLVDELGIDGERIDQLEREAREEIERLVARGLEAPWPEEDPGASEFTG